jgi:hypothetical protein
MLIVVRVHLTRGENSSHHLHYERCNSEMALNFINYCGQGSPHSTRGENSSHHLHYERCNSDMALNFINY